LRFLLRLASGAFVCAGACAHVQRQTDDRASFTIPAGSLRISIPEEICSSKNKVGETFTGHVVRRIWTFNPGELPMEGLDASMPRDLEAVFELVQVTPPPAQRIAFVVHSIRTGNLSASGLTLPTRADPEALHFSLEPPEVCYPKGGYLYAGTSTPIELR